MSITEWNSRATVLAPPSAPGPEATEAPFQVWDAGSPAETARWLAAWLSWPEREVFAHPSYVALYAANDRARAMCACWRDRGTCVLYPFLLRDLTAEPYWTSRVGPATDVITPYGYGGPACWGTNPTAALDAFWLHFNAWASRHTVVSEFVRFHLFRDPAQPYPGEVIERMPNIVRDLTPDEAEIWDDFRSEVRRKIKAARRSGVTVERDDTGERLDEFLRLYEHTLDRNGAGDWYYFPRSYFERICRELPGQFVFFHALHGGKVVSTELVLVSSANVYSFLGGTDVESFKLRPNDVVKHEIILWAKRQGKRRFVLGGGAHGADGIYHYKQGYAPTGTVPFFVGRRVLRQDLHDELVEGRRALAAAGSAPWAPAPGFFPAYRA